MIGEFCNDVINWFSADRRNIAVVHCKAGKVRSLFFSTFYKLFMRWFFFKCSLVMTRGVVESGCRGLCLFLALGSDWGDDMFLSVAHEALYRRKWCATLLQFQAYKGWQGLLSPLVVTYSSWTTDYMLHIIWVWCLRPVDIASWRLYLWGNSYINFCLIIFSFLKMDI